MQPNWSSPFSFKRAPVFAGNVVATSHPLAAQAGIDMLKRGGNAVDAALAAAITLTVVEPAMNGIGGDAFAILWKEGRLCGLNASGRSPREWTPNRFAHLDQIPNTGWESITVPGAVSAWTKLAETHGRLPFTDLFEAAIFYAEEGFHVSPVTAGSWKRQSEERLKDFEEFQRTFCPDGHSPAAGNVFRNPDQAATLREIAASHGESFYRGRLAKTIARAAEEAGAALSYQDLADHEPFFVEPLHIDYRSCRLHEIPPNGQGIAALIALGILGHFDLSAHDPDSAPCLHLQMEAMKLALSDAREWVSDSESMRDVAAAQLLEPAYLKKRVELIASDKAKPFSAGKPNQCDTVYLTAADADGTMVSFIQSNYSGFGSGIVIPGTGIAMQNRGSSFNLIEGHPNRVGGNKLPFHTIIPGFVTKNNEPLLSFGVMGGPMQAQGHVQMLIRLADFGQNPQTASDSPRWQIFEGLHVGLEDSMPAETVAGLKALGHEVEILPPSSFGGAQLALRIDGGYVTGSDHRKDGLAVGY